MTCVAFCAAADVDTAPLVAVGTDSGKIVLWALASRSAVPASVAARLRRLSAHKGTAVGALCWGTSRARLYSAGADGSIVETILHFPAAVGAAQPPAPRASSTVLFKASSAIVQLVRCARISCGCFHPWCSRHPCAPGLWRWPAARVHAHARAHSRYGKVRLVLSLCYWCWCPIHGAAVLMWVDEQKADVPGWDTAPGRSLWRLLCSHRRWRALHLRRTSKVPRVGCQYGWHR